MTPSRPRSYYRSYAWAVSVMFHPIWLPVFLVWTMQRSLLRETCLWTLVVPIVALIWLRAKHKLHSLRSYTRDERRLPYAITLLCYLIWLVGMYYHGADQLLLLFGLGAFSILAVVLLMNRFWLVSIHAAGMGGLVGVTLIYAYIHGNIHMPMLPTAIVFSLLVMYARLYLDAHTPLQTAAGWLTGLMMMILPYSVLCFAF